MADFQENAIEFLRDDDRATATFTKRRYITQIKRLAEQHPDEVEIVADDGSSIVAHIPVSYIRLKAPRQLTDAQREVLASARESLRAEA